MPSYIKRLIRILAILEYQRADQVCSRVHCSNSTFKRCVAVLRALGVRITYDRHWRTYHVLDTGIFDREKVREVVLR